MPAAYTAAQRAAIQQYVVFTKTKESTATKALKAANWDINAALNESLARFTPRRKSNKIVVEEQSASRRYYNKGNNTSKQSNAPAITAVFDKFRDDPNSPDTMGVEGTMAFLQALNVTLDEPVSIAIHHLVNAESMGELERAKFVTGWDSLPQPAAGVEAMATAAEDMRSKLRSDRDYFRAVYRHAFLLSRAPGQKSAPMDTATEIWRLMLGSGGAGSLGWATSDIDWIGLWLDFITRHGPKVVSRDLWNQTEVFARRCLEDKTLGFWTEEASWPTIIDDFVGHIKKNGTQLPQKEDTVMGD